MLQMNLVDELGGVLNVSEQFEVNVENNISSDYNYGDDYYYIPRRMYSLNVRIYNPTRETYQYFSDMMNRLYPLRSHIRLTDDNTLMTFDDVVCSNVNYDRNELSDFISVSWQTTQVHYGHRVETLPGAQNLANEPIEEEIDWLTEGF